MAGVYWEKVVPTHKLKAKVLMTFPNGQASTDNYNIVLILRLLLKVPTLPQ